MLLLPMPKQIPVAEIPRPGTTEVVVVADSQSDMLNGNPQKPPVGLQDVGTSDRPTSGNTVERAETSTSGSVQNVSACKAPEEGPGHTPVLPFVEPHVTSMAQGTKYHRILAPRRS